MESDVDIGDTQSSTIMPSSTTSNKSSSSTSDSGPVMKRALLCEYPTFIKTTSKQKKELDAQCARMIYATNSPFRLVEHQEFVKFVKLLRHGYEPPNRDNVGNKLLDEEYSLISKSAIQLNRKFRENLFAFQLMDGRIYVMSQLYVLV